MMLDQVSLSRDYVCMVGRAYNSSVIRQKDESQNGCNKKTKHTKFSEKRTFLR